MVKRLSSLALALLLLVAPLGLAEDHLAMLPGNFRGDLDTTVISFYSAYNMLCDAIYGQTITQTNTEKVDGDHALDTFVRIGMSDVQVLYRRSDLQVISVACQTEMSPGQDLGSTYLAGKSFGQTVPALLITLAYLEVGKDLDKLKPLIPGMEQTAREVIGSYEQMAAELSPDKSAQKTDTLRFEDWYITYNFSWDTKKISMFAVVHAEPL